MLRFDLQQTEEGSHAPETSSAHAAKEGELKCQRVSDTCACAQLSQASELESTSAPDLYLPSVQRECVYNAAVSRFSQGSIRPLYSTSTAASASPRFCNPNWTSRSTGDTFDLASDLNL